MSLYVPAAMHTNYTNSFKDIRYLFVLCYHSIKAKIKVKTTIKTLIKYITLIVQAILPQQHTLDSITDSNTSAAI